MRRLIFTTVILAAAGAAGWMIRGRRAATPADARHLVLITIDTLRADRLTPAAMPGLSRLAEGGLSFTHARTTAPLTLPAHASVMTGLVPPEHGARENGAPPDPSHATLADLLKARGFRTGAFVSAFVLDRQFGLARGFDTYDDAVPRDAGAALRLEAERSGRATVDAALAWLQTIDLSRDRVFLWVHLFEPHAPYAPAYDSDVRAADTEAARLVEALSGHSSIAWIVAGDHGEALGSHGEQTHGMLVYDAALRVPLLLRGPGVAAGTNASPVSLIDIAPTALSWLGVAAPSAMRGLDLRGAVPGDRDVYSESMYPQAAGWHGVAALSGPRWKVIQSSETELYDLAADAGETRNAAAAHASIAEAMGRAASAYQAASAPASRGPSPEAQERLRALGYVGGASTAPPAGSRAANPAREIDAWVAFERASTLVAAGRAREAIGDLASLASRYPAARVFGSTYARALQDTGDHAGALRVYRALVAKWSGDAMLFHDLASAARTAGRPDEAARAEQAALALDPSNAAALNGLGLTHADAGRPGDAAAAFERAAARDPGNASYWTNLGNARRALGDPSGAAGAYRRALERDAGYPDALNGQGVLLVQSGRAGEAIPLFQRALTRDAAHIEARLNLGIAYQESGRSAEAAAVYRDVLTRAPRGSREYEAARVLLGK